MALLDSKERILDIVLTDFGRELLAKNQLNFRYYAFSDEGVDYTGSLAAINNTSMSASSSAQALDNYVRRDLSFEADQRFNKDLSSFLYTTNVGSNVLPEFRVSVDVSSSVELQRKFTIDTITLENNNTKTLFPPLDVIVRGSTEKKTFLDRASDYVIFQQFSNFVSFLKGKK